LAFDLLNFFLIFVIGYMKKFLITLFCVCAVSLYGQKSTLVNSLALLRSGVEYYDNENYDKAILKFRQIPEGDTNYFLALHELVLAYNAQKNYDQSIKICKKALLYCTSKSTRSQFIQFLGNAYSFNKQLDKAIETYRLGLKEFPYHYVFYYEMAAAYYMEDKDQKALELIDTCLQLNFMYPRAHYLMGEICVENNAFVSAMLSFQMAAYLDYTGQIGLTSLKRIEAITVGSIRLKPIDSIQQIFKNGENNFDDLQEIIISQSQLNDKFKVKQKVNLPFTSIIKTLYFIDSKIDAYLENPGWYNKNILPVLHDWINQKTFPTAMYRMFNSIGSDETKKAYKKNQSEISIQFNNFFNKFISPNAIYESRLPEIKGKFKHLYLYESSHLYAMVPENQAVDLVNKLEISNGMVVYFFNEGSIVKSFGNYVNGKKSGVWTYYTPEGYLDEIDEITWEGEKIQKVKTKIYSIYGLLKTQKTSVNGVDIGPYKEYDENGVLIKEFELSNKGEIVGEIKLYHNTGNLNQKFSIVNNKFSDGVFSTYDKFGYLDFVQSYKNDQKEGVYKEYYRNGQLFATGTYVKGEKVGKWTSYHFDGTVSEISNYSAGQLDGESIEYHRNGKVFKVAKYAKNLSIGKTMLYDNDGKLFAEYDEGKGRINSVVYYDKKGNVIFDASAKKSGFTVYKCNELGIVIEEGQVKNDFRVGTWKFYTNDGALESTTEYDEKGNKAGKTNNFECGSVTFSGFNKDGELDGYFRNNYEKEKLYYEGNYVMGKLEGPIKYYNKNGVLTDENYYHDDKNDGISTHYYSNGKPNVVSVFHNNWLSRVLVFDTSGNFIHDDTMSFPTGNITIKYDNGNLHKFSPYLNGLKHGTEIEYYRNGVIKSKTNYKFNEYHGTSEGFYDNGQRRSLIHYKFGRRDSVMRTYHENGKIDRENYYVNGQSEGKLIFNFENGKLSIQGNEFNGLREGDYEYFSMDGNLQYKVQYIRGIIVSYSYYDKSGKFVTVDLKNATGELKAYFKNGNVSVVGAYLNGNRNGKYLKYGPTGKLELECNYECGNYIGEYKEYFENGKIARFQNYKENMLNGPEFVYNEQGVLLKETNWVDDEKHGVEKIYMNGKVIKTQYYFFGDLYEK
jgi:hypothetical protein